MVITINISEQQFRRATQLVELISRRSGFTASRSQVVGKAIDVLFLSECRTYTSSDVSIKSEAIAEPAV